MGASPSALEGLRLIEPAQLELLDLGLQLADGRHLRGQARVVGVVSVRARFEVRRAADLEGAVAEIPAAEASKRGLLDATVAALAEMKRS